jgi:hypothetical protein
MKKVFYWLLLVALTVANIMFLSSAHANERRRSTQNERIAAHQANAIDAGVAQSASAANATLDFCKRIGRVTRTEQVDLEVDSRDESRLESRGRAGTYYVFGQPVEQRVDNRVEVNFNGRVTCKTAIEK